MEKKVWGSFNGEDVILYTLKAGKYVLSVMTKGATVVYYGTENYNAVLSHKTFLDYLSPGNGHRGEVVGPVANRIANASFSIDGKVYTLGKNFHSRHTLHSAGANWGDRNWKEVAFKEDGIELSLHTQSLDGGFPGDHDVNVKYTLNEEGELSILYRVKSSEKCPLAMTNHTYFVLDDRDSRYVKVMIPSREYIEVESTDLIPLVDNPTPVKGTDYDFTTPVLVGERRGGAYDNTWLLEKDAVITAEGNKASLTVRTDEPGVQMYTASTLPDAFCGIAFETGRCPDTPNRPDFPQCWSDRDKEYRSYTKYRISVK